MYTASALRRSNIAEHLLYMWQIEDMLRANNLDIENIRRNVVDRYSGLSDEQRKELTEWYESLIDMMRREGVEKKGHLQLNRNLLGRLVELHQALLKDPRFADYTAEFYRTLPFIVELRSKAGENPAGEIETCFNALYGMLMLRLKSQEVSDATRNAVSQISRFIAALAELFHKDEAEGLFKPE